MPNQTYAVIGTGAVGGFYGAKLQKAGFEVHFLLRSDYETVKKQGLTVESPEGNFHLSQVHCYQNPQEIPPCDGVIIALKTTQNLLIPSLLQSVLKPNSTVLVLQNGLGNEAAIATQLQKHFPKINISLVGGLCFLCSNKLKPGIIQHLDYGMVTLGAHLPQSQTPHIPENVRQIGADFEAAGIPIRLAPDLILERWKKLLWNIPFNGLSVVLNAQTNELMESKATEQLVRDLMQEVEAIAAADGHPIPADFAQYLLDLTQNMFPYRTSMKLDYDGQREMEIDALFSQPLQVAQTLQVSAPKIEMLFQQLQWLNGTIKKS